MTSFRATLASVLPFTLSALMLAPAQADEPANNARWVSDSLNTYVRSGPTDGHRIVGALRSGDQVTLITRQGNYAQIRTESGSTVWIPDADLQDVPGQAERIPQLEAELAELSTELNSINESWELRVQGMQETLESRKVLIDELEAQRLTLNDQLTDAQSELRSAQARLGDESQEALLRYMLYGGGIAGAGLLVGLILPSLTRRKKRSSDVWV
ncbi:TIGR04211 family SH3 domain-containing protein [Halopseudomonas salegens]|uniref:SH3 domain protein n=1 Tax=Halopseudomonas salegens TaxID=1434072 RepID=A0A1H2E9M9_9GAMM|nr:TIGR04211 family SH3 domain-containing protein [Halopseudomonas salegens]SDT91861.1 SH3 domain protein [Halopseudomonas salegens]